MDERTEEVADALNRLAARVARLEEALVEQTKAITLYIQKLTETQAAIAAARRPWWRR